MTSIRVVENWKNPPKPPGQVVGGYIDWNTGLCKPIIKNPVVGTNTGGGGKGGTTVGSGSNNLTKTANSDIFESSLLRFSEISSEESVALMSLSTTEILQILRNYSMTSNSSILNNNVLDKTDTINAINPIQIIKTQNSNTEYLSSSTKTVEETTVAVNTATGNTTVSVPAATVSSSSTPSSPATNSSSSAPTTSTPQIKVEVQTPAQTVTQNTTPTWNILSIEPTSQKKGKKITLYHEKCNVGRVTQIGQAVVTGTSGVTASKMTLNVPNVPELVVGQSYEVSITIKGQTKKAPMLLTIIA